MMFPVYQREALIPSLCGDFMLWGLGHLLSLVLKIYRCYNTIILYTVYIQILPFVPTVFKNS